MMRAHLVCSRRWRVHLARAAVVWLCAALLAGCGITAHPIAGGGLSVSVIFPRPASPAACPESHSQSDRHSLEIENVSPARTHHDA